jgi:hypothetical protein
MYLGMEENHPCYKCGKPSIFLTTDGKDICRWCHPPHDTDTRNALNHLKDAGMIWTQT